MPELNHKLGDVVEVRIPKTYRFDLIYQGKTLRGKIIKENKKSFHVMVPVPGGAMWIYLDKKTGKTHA